jgi:hypothetical protein
MASISHAFVKAIHGFAQRDGMEIATFAKEQFRNKWCKSGRRCWARCGLPLKTP